MRIILSTLLFLMFISSCAVDDGSDGLDFGFVGDKGVGRFVDTTIIIESNELNYDGIKSSLSSYSLLWFGKSEHETYSPILYFDYDRTKEDVQGLKIVFYTDSTFVPLVEDTIYSTISLLDTNNTDTIKIVAPLIYVADTSSSQLKDSVLALYDRKGYAFKVSYQLPQELYPYFEDVNPDSSEEVTFKMILDGSAVDTLLAFYPESNPENFKNDVRTYIEITSKSLDTIVTETGSGVVSEISIDKLRPEIVYVQHATTYQEDSLAIKIGNRRLNSFTYFARNYGNVMDNFTKNIFLEFFYKEQNNRAYYVADTIYEGILSVHYFGAVNKTSKIVYSDVKDSVVNGEKLVYVSKDITLWGINMLNEEDTLGISPSMDIPYLFDVEIKDLRLRVEQSYYIEPEGN